MNTIPPAVCSLIETAIYYGVIEREEVYLLGMKHGSNWRTLVDDLLDVARMDTESALDRFVHSKLREAADLALSITDTEATR